MTILSLFFISGCGKQKKQRQEKDNKVVKAVEVKTEATAESSNLISNPSFEKGRTFDSGIYKKGKYAKEEPAGWITSGQILDNFAGWATGEAHSGKRSLKIENISGKKAYWKGDPVIINRQVESLIFSGWGKSNNAKAIYDISFDVFFKGEKQPERISLFFNKGTNDWEQMKQEVCFNKFITEIVPRLNLNSLGTVWFDDLCIKIPDKKENENGSLVYNGDFKLHDAEGPYGWRTVQKTGKVNSWGVDKISKRYYVIIKNSKKSNSYWVTKKPFTINKAINKIKFSASCKTFDVSKKAAVQVCFGVRYMDETWQHIRLYFKNGTHKWERLVREVNFSKPIKYLVVSPSLYHGTGTCWFSDIDAEIVNSGNK